MPTINIGGQVILFPNAGSDSSWAPPVIQFAEAVEAVLNGIQSPYDVSNKVQTILIDGITVPDNYEIANAEFPNVNVRSFSLSYSIYRTNGVTTQNMNGVFSGEYDTLSSQWFTSDQFTGDVAANGSPLHEFYMSGDQVNMAIVALGGAYDTTNSKISYSARTQLVSTI